jgi:hypothetical protein
MESEIKTVQDLIDALSCLSDEQKQMRPLMYDINNADVGEIESVDIETAEYKREGAIFINAQF